MLKMTGIELELVSDIELHLFIEKRLREAISYIAKNCSKANNIYMKDFDSSKESKYIIYLDANSLFGWAISQYLTNGGFNWLTEEEIKNFAVN